MPEPVTMSRSRTYPVAFDEAFGRWSALPLPEVFDRRVGAFPPIVAVEQDGSWGTPGATRTIRTSDGGEMLERLVTFDPPTGLTYELAPQGGPLKPLVTRIDGAWRFEPVGTGTRITWSWTAHPSSAFAGRTALRLFARLWQGYARRALDRIEEHLLAA